MYCPMEVSLALLADAANSTANKKLNVDRAALTINMPSILEIQDAAVAPQWPAASSIARLRPVRAISSSWYSNQTVW